MSLSARERRVRREAARYAKCPQCRRPHLTYAGGESVQCRKCGYLGEGGDSFKAECRRVDARKANAHSLYEQRRLDKMREQALP